MVIVLETIQEAQMSLKLETGTDRSIQDCVAHPPEVIETIEV